MLLIQYVALLIGPIVAVWEHFRKPAAGRTHRYLIPILLLTSLSASCWLAYDANNKAKKSREEADQANISAAKWQAEAKKWQGEATAQMSRIEGKLGSEQMTQRYLDSVRTLTQQYANADTGTAADRFFGSHEERIKLREEIKQANANLLLSSKIRIQPIHDLVVAKLDQWRLQLERRNFKVTVEKHDPPVVILGPVTRRWEMSFSVKFESGDTLSVMHIAGTIEDGRLVDPYILRILFTSKAGDGDDFFQLRCAEKEYVLTNQKPGKFAAQTVSGNLENPIEDKTFITSVNNAMDQVVGYMLDR